jgi:hypothetical protein
VTWVGLQRVKDRDACRKLCFVGRRKLIERKGRGLLAAVLNGNTGVSRELSSLPYLTRIFSTIA